MHVPKSRIIILSGKCIIRKIRCIICFRVYISCCYHIFYFLHISFYKYAFLQTDLDLYAFQIGTYDISSQMHTVRISTTCILCSSCCSLQTLFVKSCPCLYLRFCLNSPLAIRKANVLAFGNCSESSLSFQ